MRLVTRSLIRLFLSLTLAAPLLHAATPEELAVLAPIQALFDGMTKRDAGAIQQPLLPGGSLVLMRTGKPSQMTFAAFAERVGKPGRTHIEERIYDPTIHIDGDLAVVWAAFDFFVDGKVDHCGTDLFNLIHVDGRWLIASISDTDHVSCPAR